MLSRSLPAVFIHSTKKRCISEPSELHPHLLEFRLNLLRLSLFACTFVCHLLLQSQRGGTASEDKMTEVFGSMQHCGWKMSVVWQPRISVITVCSWMKTNAEISPGTCWTDTLFLSRRHFVDTLMVFLWRATEKQTLCFFFSAALTATALQCSREVERHREKTEREREIITYNNTAPHMTFLHINVQQLWCCRHGNGRRFRAGVM